MGNRNKAIKSIRDVRKERLRLEYELKFSSQQLKIRSLELQNQFNIDRLLFYLFKKALNSVFGRVRNAMGEKQETKREKKD